MTKSLRKYFSIIFLLSVLIGATHHHDDLRVHSDCKICVLQSNISSADTPTQSSFLPNTVAVFEDIVTPKNTVCSKKLINPLHQRAPPFFS